MCCTLNIVIDNREKTARIRNRYNQVPHLSQDTKFMFIISELLFGASFKRESESGPWFSSMSPSRSSNILKNV